METVQLEQIANNLIVKLEPACVEVLKQGVNFVATEALYSIFINIIFFIVCFISIRLVCGNMVEDILTKSVYKVDKEREDLENYINSLTKNKIPSELEYKLKNTGKYLHGQYNFIK